MNPDPIKAKIQVLVPDVMELKFGCEVKEPKTDTLLTYVGINNKQRCFFIPSNQALLFVDKLGAIEILGSPITLAVVLRALNKHYSNFKFYPSADITEHWCFTDFRGGMERWDLAKDYDQQSDECKQFIGSLLGV